MSTIPPLYNFNPQATPALPFDMQYGKNGSGFPSMATPPFTYGTPNYAGSYSPPTEGGFSYGTPNYNSGGFSPYRTPPINGDPQSAPIQQSNSAPSGMGIAGAVFGPVQAGIALYQMAKMAKETKPGYNMSGDLSTAIGDARKYKDQGFTASQRAAYEQSIGQGEANAYKAATLLGGGIDQTVMAILKGNNTAARNQFGIADANQQVQNRQYFGNMAQVGQNQDNMNTTEDLKDWWYRKQNNAALLNAGITNTAQGISSGAIKAITAGLG